MNPSTVSRRSYFLRVAAARPGARGRAGGEPRGAARRACRARAFLLAARWPSRLRARRTARDRFTEVDPLPLLLLRRSRDACFRVRAEAAPVAGAGSSTPARRALDNP